MAREKLPAWIYYDRENHRRHALMRFESRVRLAGLGFSAVILVATGVVVLVKALSG